jgi:predicted phage tail protein
MEKKSNNLSQIMLSSTPWIVIGILVIVVPHWFGRRSGVELPMWLSSSMGILLIIIGVVSMISPQLRNFLNKLLSRTWKRY